MFFVAVCASEGAVEQSIALFRPATVPFRLFGNAVYGGRAAADSRRHDVRHLALLQQHRTTGHVRRLLHVVAARPDPEHGRQRPVVDGTGRTRNCAAVRRLRTGLQRLGSFQFRSHSQADGLHHFTRSRCRR